MVNMNQWFKMLEQKMQETAEAMDFEKAAELRGSNL